VHKLLFALIFVPIGCNIVYHIFWVNLGVVSGESRCGVVKACGKSDSDLIADVYVGDDIGRMRCKKIRTLVAIDDLRIRSEILIK
jgi:hypothetical protein